MSLSLQNMACRRYPLWTDAEDRQLRALALHATADAIAIQVGRTRDGVRYRAQTLGIALGIARHYTAADDRLIRAYAGIESSAAIGRRLGRTARAIRTRASKLGISMRCYGDRHHSMKYPEAMIESIRTLADDGLKPPAISARYPGISRSRLHRYLSFAERANG